MKLNQLGDPRRGDAAVPLRERGAAVAWPSVSVSVAGVRRGDASALRFAESIVRALTLGGQAPAVYQLGRGEGAFEPASASRAQTFLDAGARHFEGGRVAADAQEIDDLIDRFAQGAGTSPCVLIGTDFMARSNSDVSVIISGGAPALAWSPAARSVLERVSLILVEPRDAVAEGIARELMARLG